MADQPNSGLGTSPRPITAASPDRSRAASPASHSVSRATSTARLASSVTSSMQAGTPPPVRQIPGASQIAGDRSDPQLTFPGAEASSSVTGPGTSAIAEALRGAEGQSSPRFNSTPLRPLSPAAAGATLPEVSSMMGSFDGRHSLGGRGSPVTYENPEIVRRHLVQPTKNQSITDKDRKNSGKSSKRSPSAAHRRGDSSDEEFSSLRLQGGDITRQVYRWTEEAEAQSQGRGRTKRSRSFDISRPNPSSEVLDIISIKQPGGFRRNYLRRAAESPSPAASGGYGTLDSEAGVANGRQRPKLLTSNFIEFLSLYGHFAGEELEEDDEVLGPDEYFSSDTYDEGDYFTDEGDEGREPGEGSALLTPGTPGKRRRKRKERAPAGTNSAWGAVLLLLKSFVGTGVLFLPKAYLNGGMLFSNIVLLVVALLSYYCFILLVNTRLAIDGSFGDIGGVLYGKHMRNLILISIVVSQIGFASAYIVFTSQNLQAFILAVSHCRTFIDIKLMILMQLIIFLPLSLIRNISKLGATALIADLLILLGLIYLYYYDIFTLVSQHGVADIVQFNSKDWTLFIGTAIFTFEGIGLIIPIQESMKKPKQFPPVLGGVMVLITVVFMSMGALSYAAYGSKTQTVVILNMPQDNKFVNGVQFLYSLAILLSTPLQLFPAIRITENELFTRSGKYNPYIKWKKNVFRFFLVMLCAMIAWVGANDLDKFVALVGSFACVPLVYVYPPLLHLRAVARSRFQRLSDYAIFVFGLVVMIYTTVLTLKSWAGGPAEETPGYCKN